ncbi:MAG TPA: hypothetical protein VGM73_05670 [Candidatus Didemnitutus sp.]
MYAYRQYDLRNAPTFRIEDAKWLDLFVTRLDCAPKDFFLNHTKYTIGDAWIEKRVDIQRNTLHDRKWAYVICLDLAPGLSKKSVTKFPLVIANGRDYELLGESKNFVLYCLIESVGTTEILLKDKETGEVVPILTKPSKAAMRRRCGPIQRHVSTLDRSGTLERSRGYCPNVAR